MQKLHANCFLSLFLALTFVACSQAPVPDHYDPGTRVTLMVRMVSLEPFKLGPRSSQLFLDMLTNQPVRSEYGQFPARPMGKFTVGSTDYLWHGNGVIRGKGRDERFWHGPYVQKLIIEVMRQEHGNRESIQHILDSLENDTTVASTPLEGPGAYPGGTSGTLHPASRP